MLDRYTQVIVEEFRKHEAFSERTRKWLADADTQSLSPSERQDYVARSMQATCLFSMVKIQAPHFALEILIKAIDTIDWQEAAKALYFLNTELN